VYKRQVSIGIEYRQKRFVGACKSCYKAAMKRIHIDSYQFGKIVIEGVSYNSDLIILTC